jgi:hypothetical protein
VELWAYGIDGSDGLRTSDCCCWAATCRATGVSRKFFWGPSRSKITPYKVKPRSRRCRQIPTHECSLVLTAETGRERGFGIEAGEKQLGENRWRVLSRWQVHYNSFHNPFHKKLLVYIWRNAHDAHAAKSLGPPARPKVARVHRLGPLRSSWL